MRDVAFEDTQKILSSSSRVERELQVLLPLYVVRANYVHCTGAIIVGETLRSNCLVRNLSVRLQHHDIGGCD